MFPRVLIVAVIVAAPLSHGAAAEPSIDFVRDVRPILERSCIGCHGPEKQKSGYRLDLRRAAFKGGDSGEAAILPHQAAISPLLRFVSGEDPDTVMPPKKSDVPPLTSEEIATLRTWIGAGAPWPDAVSGDKPDERLAHWAWQPLVRPSVPASAHANPIDAFLSAKLTEKACPLPLKRIAEH